MVFYVVKFGIFKEARAVDIGLMHYLVICPLVFLAGFVDAVAGGGGLISLPAYLLMGLPVHMAIGTNKLGSAMGTATACWRYAAQGFVNWRLAPLCVGCAFVGSACGARLALLLEEGIFRILMLVILPLTAVYVMRAGSLNRAAGDGAKKNAPARTGGGRLYALAALASLGIGVYDGFYGPGTGTFLLLLLTGLAGMALADANGLCKIVNLTTNLAALLVFCLQGQVIVPLGLAAGCFSIAGNMLGVRCFVRQGAGLARPLILLVLGIFFVKTLIDLIS